MRKIVFDCLYHGVRCYADYFVLKKDAVGMIGFSGYQKCTDALRMLAYGTSALRMSECLRAHAEIPWSAIAAVAILTEGKAPPCHFTVNVHEYSMAYYLVDGIYPPWATFVSTISNPVGQKKSHFAQREEAVRKDVERAFGVLQARFAVFVDLLNNGN
ncbi:uncharacterized protein [Aegilops tauschii subsp. strangulata]|uniref:uncharacterized protein n=1 Tax=Aegilops tauschii subsp. strangulata TaxID=200361 RepID=UPI003CC89879